MPPKFSGFGLASSLKKGARPALAAFKDDETKRPPPGQQAQAAEVPGTPQVRRMSRRQATSSAVQEAAMEIDEIPLDDMSVKQLKAYLTKQGTPWPRPLGSALAGSATGVDRA
jgi:hypothetical protein